MKKVWVLLILLLISCVYPAITRNALDIKIYVNDDGSAHVVEKNQYFIEGNQSIINYQNSLNSFTNKNDITYWLSMIGSSNAPSYHIDPGKGIKNVIITPSNLYTYSNKVTARASITVEYDLASEEDENETIGVFLIRKIKPRTKEYVLNIESIRFQKNEQGDVFLPEDTTIEFILPDDAVITSLQPFPSSLEERSFPIYNIKTLTWKNEITLPRFAIIFYKEQRLDEEMMDFFTDLQQKLVQKILGKDGWAIMIIVAVLLISYVASQKIKSKKDGEVHGAA